MTTVIKPAAMCLGKEQGVMLLELLFVIALIGIIVTLSLQRLARVSSQMAWLTLRQDIKAVQQSVQDYVVKQGCAANGDFKGDLQPDLIKDLHGEPIHANRWLSNDASALHVKISAHPFVTATISVRMQHQLPKADLIRLQNKLAATEIRQDTVIWRYRPGVGGTGDQPLELWQGRLRFFRKFATPLTDGQYAANCQW